jgi:CRISPR-associated protein (TIGR03984 family)
MDTWEGKFNKKMGFSEKPLENVPSDESFETWLLKHAENGDILLAHADDGVIWGYVDNNQLHTSDKVAPNISPPLSPITLQQLRLFNQKQELRVWRTGKNAFRAAIIADEKSSSDMAFDEDHLLWGTKAELKNNFFLLEDGEQGLRHVIPAIEGIRDGEILLEKRICLKVRHYLQEADNGVNSIAVSRLVKLGVKPNDKPE